MATGKGNVVNTTRGLQLITKLVSAQTKLTFTNVKIGTGSPQEGVDPSELTHLVAYKMDGQIAEYGYDDGAGEAYVVMQLTNTSIVTGFVMTEIGLYAQDPDLGEILYAYVDLSDDPNYIMPPENGRSKTIQIKLHTIVGEVANITATINPLAQVTRAEFERELASKVDSIGGDTADTLVSAFDASSDSFPVPAAKEKARTRWGKMKKFTEDFRNWMTGVCLIGQIVNNCVTDRTDLPLSAAQGKVLMDLYTVLNTNSSKIGHAHDERYYTEAEVNNLFNTYQGLPQYSMDLFNVQSGGRLLYYDANTKNTPYKAGITQASEGVAITVGDWGNFITSLAIPKGDSRLYIYSRANSIITDWKML